MPFADFLRQSADVMVLQAYQDANGGQVQAWVTQATAVPCLVQPWSGSAFREEERDGSLATHRIMLLGAHQLSAGNQIHVGSLKYNVLKCRDWNSLGHHTTVECTLETS